MLAWDVAVPRQRLQTAAVEHTLKRDGNFRLRMRQTRMHSGSGECLPGSNVSAIH